MGALQVGQSPRRAGAAMDSGDSVTEEQHRELAADDPSPSVSHFASHCAGGHIGCSRPFIYYARTGSLIQATRCKYTEMHGHRDSRPALDAAAGISAQPSRVRLLILTLLTFGTLINYLDRTVISVAAPLMTTELGLDAVTMGIVFSAFSWTYAAAQIPGGILLDRIGVRLTYFLSVTIWSAFTLLQGLATNLWSLIACRMGLGVAEAPGLSVEQPGTRHLVSAGRARLGHRRLFDRPVLRPRLPEPAAVLDCRRLSAGARCSSSSAPRESCSASSGMRSIAIRTRAAPTRPSSTTSPRAAALAAASRMKFEWRHIALPAAPAADPRRVDRTVREQFHAGVLPHLVPHLPRAPSGRWAGSRSGSSPSCRSSPPASAS